MLKKLALLFGLALPATAGDKPNIIYILTDDLGWGDYGTFFQNLRKEKGDRSEPWHMTPELDKMAAEGLQLPHHYCPAPVCAPSRASLLLGVHQGHSEIRDNQFDKELPDNHTLATVMKGAGYATAAFGKWGLQGGLTGKEKKGDSKLWPGYPTKRGFDFFHGYVRHKDGHAHYPKEDGKELWENNDEISADLDGCYTADLFTARAKKWIADLHATDPEKPFFAYLAYDTPHAKAQLPAAPYPEGGIRWLGEKGHMINTADGKPDSWTHPDYATATWDADKDPATPEIAWPDVYKRYATSVRRIDDCVGDLIRTLKELGIDGNTLIVFTTDNGPSQESYLKQPLEADFFNSFGPFDGIKRDVIEGGIRTGAIVRWPAVIAPDSVNDIPCQSHDWMPTFAELAGVAAPARSDGTSLLPTIARMGSQKDPQVYVEYSVGGGTPNYPEFTEEHRGRKRGQMQAIRFGDFIGVRYSVKSHADPFQIFNIVSDPQQTKDLAMEMTGLQKKMHDAILQMRRPNPSAPRPYDNEPVPAIAGKSSPGIIWRSFAKQSPWLARLDDLTPASEGTLETITDAAPSADSVLFTGTVEIPAEAPYTFHLPANALALLRIHDATVIDAAHADSETETESSGTIVLAKGKHPFRLYWKNGKTKPALEISGPSTKRSPIAKEMLGH